MFRIYQNILKKCSLTLLEIMMHLTEIDNRNIQAQKDEALLQKLHNQQFSDRLIKHVMICYLYYNYLKFIQQHYYDVCK